MDHLHDRRILIVDDDVSLLDALQRALSQNKRHAVTACSTFEEARQQLRDQAFDVLLTDVRLGAFNGLQLAGLAKDLNPSTRVIVFSGFDDAVLRTEAERLGATYVVKPVSSEKLLALMQSADATQ